MIYEEGDTVGGSEKTYVGTINVTSDLPYDVKFEVLRSDLGNDHEKVSEISFNSVSFGECNPPGGDYDCDFYDCSSKLTKSELFSTTGTIKVELTYVGHSHDCDCDKKTWDCSPEQGQEGHNSQHDSRMIAAARITLTPKEGGKSGGNKTDNF